MFLIYMVAFFLTWKFLTKPWEEAHEYSKDNGGCLSIHSLDKDILACRDFAKRGEKRKKPNEKSQRGYIKWQTQALQS